jgi:hypothetical protein
LETAGFKGFEIQVSELILEMPPLTEFIPLHISATPMAAGFQQATFTIQAAIVQEVIEQIRSNNSNGSNQISFRSYMIGLKN